MNIPLEVRAKQLWPNNTNYQAQWLRMVELLGSNWLLSKKVVRCPR